MKLVQLPVKNKVHCKKLKEIIHKMMLRFSFVSVSSRARTRLQFLQIKQILKVRNMHITYNASLPNSGCSLNLLGVFRVFCRIHIGLDFYIYLD